MLIELLSSTLPWKGMARKDSAHVKQTVSDRTLLAVSVYFANFQLILSSVITDNLNW